jgi:hypothetical protein
MAYTTEISNLLAATLGRMTTLNAHQLAGHVANLDFWLSEVKHCIQVIDGYRERFRAMKAAEMRYTGLHQTMTYSGEPMDFSDPWDVRPPSAIPKAQFAAAKSELLDAANRFLLRCYQSRLIDEKSLRQAADSIGVSVEGEAIQENDRDAP